MSRWQLHEWGLHRYDLRTELRAGRWWLPTANTVALSVGELSVRQRWWVALLETGCGDAALDGLTALQAAGLTGIDGPVVVSCPHGSRPRPVSGVQVRVTRWRRPGDVVIAGIPRVGTPQAVVHAALWSPSQRQAALVVVSAVQQRLTAAARVSAALTQIPRHPRRQWLAQVVQDVTDGAQALGELDFARLCRRYGLPRPSRQAVRRTSQGRCYLDVAFDAYGVVVEIDGIQHLHGLSPVHDALRQNAVSLSGELVLRIPLLGLRTMPAQFMAQIQAALESRGGG